jgi:hypothetical protein
LFGRKNCIKHFYLRSETESYREPNNFRTGGLPNPIDFSCSNSEVTAEKIKKNNGKTSGFKIVDFAQKLCANNIVDIKRFSGIDKASLQRR